MTHPTDPDELLEVPGDELRPVVRDDPGPLVGEALAGPLEDRLDVDSVLRWRISQWTMNRL
jgi:hypothetical protein